MEKAQHELFGEVQVVRSYDLDTLGAPFKVTLVNGVTISLDPVSGKEMVEIPDMGGLIGAVVRARALHPRKMSGDDIKFIRKALAVRAKSVADFLDVSAEHFSRCESGPKTLSSGTEIRLRMFAYWATLFDSSEELLARIGQQKTRPNLERLDEEVAVLFADVMQQFIDMRIEPVFDPADELHLRMVRRPRRIKILEPKGSPSDEQVWSDKALLADAAYAA